MVCLLCLGEGQKWLHIHTWHSLSACFWAKNTLIGGFLPTVRRCLIFQWHSPCIQQQPELDEHFWQRRFLLENPKTVKPKLRRVESPVAINLLLAAFSENWDCLIRTWDKGRSTERKWETCPFQNMQNIYPDVWDQSLGFYTTLFRARTSLFGFVAHKNAQWLVINSLQSFNLSHETEDSDIFVLIQFNKGHLKGFRPCFTDENNSVDSHANTWVGRDCNPAAARWINRWWIYWVVPWVCLSAESLVQPGAAAAFSGKASRTACIPFAQWAWVAAERNGWAGSQGDGEVLLGLEVFLKIWTGTARKQI